MYFVCLDNDVQGYASRESAVIVAKDLSDESRGHIDVVSEDFRESLRFEDGELTRYVHELRHGRRAVR